MEINADQLQPGDTITDGRLEGRVVNNPFTPKRKPHHVAFDVRVGPTIYAVCVPTTQPITLISRDRKATA